MLDFLAPKEDVDQVVSDGTTQFDSEIAAFNSGDRLRPFALEAGALLDRDAQDRPETVDLVYGPGKARVNLRHTGPVGFLAAKAAALNNRAELKDGYDVSWWCLNAHADPAEVAKLVSSRPAFNDPLMVESIALLKGSFAEVDFQGPTGYAELARSDSSRGSEEYSQARLDAFLAVNEVLKHLESSIDWQAVAAEQGL